MKAHIGLLEIDRDFEKRIGFQFDSFSSLIIFYVR